jgi:hypothetical protein
VSYVIQNGYCEHDLRTWILQDLCVVAPTNAEGTLEDREHEILKNHEAENEDFLTLSEQPRDGIIIMTSI